MTIGGLVRHLPKRQVKEDFKVALFMPLGDWEFNEFAGKALAALVPPGTDVLVMPDGKAQALLHVVGRETGLPTLIAKKEKKPYMQEPVLCAARDVCMTSNNKEAFYLGADDAAKLNGKRVVLLDDVVSTGGSIRAMRDLMNQAGAAPLVEGASDVVCVFTEGGARPGVICLGDLPLNAPEW